MIGIEQLNRAIMEERKRTQSFQSGIPDEYLQKLFPDLNEVNDLSGGCCLSFGDVEVGHCRDFLP